MSRTKTEQLAAAIVKIDVLINSEPVVGYHEVAEHLQAAHDRLHEILGEELADDLIRKVADA